MSLFQKELKPDIEFQQQVVTKIHSKYIAGYIETINSLSIYDVFIASEAAMIKNDYNTYVFKDGLRIEISGIQILIEELQKLKEILEARKIARELADN